jgi:hypothetical protein
VEVWVERCEWRCMERFVYQVCVSGLCIIAKESLNTNVAARHVTPYYLLLLSPSPLPHVHSKASGEASDRCLLI